jgi:hypothetical protein
MLDRRQHVLAAMDAIQALAMVIGASNAINPSTDFGRREVLDRMALGSKLGT